MRAVRSINFVLFNLEFRLNDAIFIDYVQSVTLECDGILFLMQNK